MCVYFLIIFLLGCSGEITSSDSLLVDDTSSVADIDSDSDSGSDSVLDQHTDSDGSDSVESSDSFDSDSDSDLYPDSDIDTDSIEDSDSSNFCDYCPLNDRWPVELRRCSGDILIETRVVDMCVNGACVAVQTEFTTECDFGCGVVSDRYVTEEEEVVYTFVKDCLCPEYSVYCGEDNESIVSDSYVYDVEGLYCKEIIHTEWCVYGSTHCGEVGPGVLSCIPD